MAEWRFWRRRTQPTPRRLLEVRVVQEGKRTQVFTCMDANRAISGEPLVMANHRGMTVTLSTRPFDA